MRGLGTWKVYEDKGSNSKGCTKSYLWEPCWIGKKRCVNTYTTVWRIETLELFCYLWSRINATRVCEATVTKTNEVRWYGHLASAEKRRWWCSPKVLKFEVQGLRNPCGQSMKKVGIKKEGCCWLVQIFRCSEIFPLSFVEDKIELKPEWWW